MWTFQTSRASPEVAAALAPQAAPAADAPAACSDISDTQLLALTDTTSLTADQLDRRHHLLRHRSATQQGDLHVWAGLDHPPPCARC